MKDKYESFEDFMQDEIESRPRWNNEAKDKEELHILKTRLQLKQIADERRRARYREKACPVAGFSPCRLDDCELFENALPGLPWWGRCRLGRWSAD